MLNSLFTLLARAQKGIVLAELALAAVYIAVDVPRGGEVGKALLPFTFASSLVAGLLWWIGMRHRPAALVQAANRRAFEAPPGPVPILAFTTVAPFVTEKLSTTIDRVSQQTDPWWLDILTSTLWVLALMLVARLVWRGAGVHLRPDGVHDRRIAGSLFVPWEALDAEQPPTISRPMQVKLTYRRPALVQSRGLLRRMPEIAAWNVDSVFVARAIQEYVSHPEHRTAIGTEAELGRLRTAIAE
ncbi:hypothetical protein [Actinoplanes xinjiangensis]|uniref:hypothetical protein n=1 Tax=Actinoplanes xinjiangensis TaxID=512350 RepID=UPI00341753EF